MQRFWCVIRNRRHLVHSVRIRFKIYSDMLIQTFNTCFKKGSLKQNSIYQFSDDPKSTWRSIIVQSTYQNKQPEAFNASYLIESCRAKL